jgi:hypothetical protein
MTRTVKTNFGTYQVYEDNFRGPLVPRSNQIRESELKQLQQAWTNIHQGKGMNITGSAADKAEWDKMLIQGMTTSSTFRDTIIRIGTDPKNTVTVNLGRNQPGVIGDSFANNRVDLADLGKFPTIPTAGHSNRVVQSELILHFLEERHYALANNTGFAPAHQRGLDVQNAYRTEKGQSRVVSQNGTSNPDGSITGNVILENGTREIWQIDAKQNFTSITPPNNPKQQKKSGLLDSPHNSQSALNEAATFAQNMLDNYGGKLERYRVEQSPNGEKTLYEANSSGSETALLRVMADGRAIALNQISPQSEEVFREVNKELAQQQQATNNTQVASNTPQLALDER